MADIPISYPIIVMAFVAATAVIGILAVKFVKKSSKNYIVAGKSLPLFFVGTMLVSEAVDGNASLGNVALSYQFGFWAGADHSTWFGYMSCFDRVILWKDI